MQSNRVAAIHRLDVTTMTRAWESTDTNSKECYFLQQRCEIHVSTPQCSQRPGHLTTGEVCRFHNPTAGLIQLGLLASILGPQSAEVQTVTGQNLTEVTQLGLGRSLHRNLHRRLQSNFNLVPWAYLFAPFQDNDSV